MYSKNSDFVYKYLEDTEYKIYNIKGNENKFIEDLFK